MDLHGFSGVRLPDSVTNATRLSPTTTPCRLKYDTDRFHGRFGFHSI